MATIPETEFERLFPAIAADVGRGEIAPLLAALEEIRVAAGAPLIGYRGRSDHLYFIRAGRMRVWLEAEGQPLVLGEIGPGKWVGEVTVLDHGPATATVAAVETSTLLSLSRAAFDELRARHPRIAARLVQALCRDLANRLRRTQFGPGEGGDWRTRAGCLIGAEAP
jgi:CRP-like cAMP-binding protein